MYINTSNQMTQYKTELTKLALQTAYGTHTLQDMVVKEIIHQWWCKKEWNKGSRIFFLTVLYLATKDVRYYKSAEFRTVKI